MLTPWPEISTFAFVCNGDMSFFVREVAGLASGNQIELVAGWLDQSNIL